MVQKVTIAASLTSAALFGWSVPLVRLFDAFHPVIVALSIMIAAILVRLNRGMPTLDWKSLEATERTRLTKSILDLTREYAVIVAVMSVFLIALLFLTVIGKMQVQSSWSNEIQIFVSSMIGGMSALCLARMAYVIWRDYDIVRLQKTLIDASGLREDKELEIKSAEQKVSNIRSAGLRKVGTGEVKPWSD